MRVLHFLFLLAVAAELSVPAVLGVPMVNTELDRGIAMANVAATLESVFYEQAEQVYSQVKTVLPKISGLSRGEQAALQTKVRICAWRWNWYPALPCEGPLPGFLRRSVQRSLSAEASSGLSTSRGPLPALPGSLYIGERHAFRLDAKFAGDGARHRLVEPVR